MGARYLGGETWLGHVPALPEQTLVDNHDTLNAFHAHGVEEWSIGAAFEENQISELSNRTS